MSRLDLGEPVDAVTFCSLIGSGDTMMDQEPREWQAVTDRNFSPAEKAAWADVWKAPDGRSSKNDGM